MLTCSLLRVMSALLPLPQEEMQVDKVEDEEALEQMLTGDEVVERPIDANTLARRAHARERQADKRQRDAAAAGAAGGTSTQDSMTPPPGKKGTLRSGLFLFDHSSGHEAAAADGHSVTKINKGPDWTAAGVRRNPS